MFRKVGVGALLHQSKVPNPGSSLLNPRSQRAKLRQMMATHQAQSEHFEAQALHADIGGSAGDGEDDARGRRGSSRKMKRKQLGRQSRGERSKEHSMTKGKRLAEEVKFMSDAEWEAVPLEEKHTFTKYISKLLRETPTQVTEQQRRRYFETTMMDPRELDANRTVVDPYERVKLGLPVQLKDPQRTLGVSEAIYASGEASLFDPSKANELENAMIHVKQVFADYMAKRKEGVSTESERRQLANLTAALNLETQRHLANMFHYAEERVRQLAMEERKEQLSELQRLRAAVRRQQPPQKEDADDDIHNGAKEVDNDGNSATTVGGDSLSSSSSMNTHSTTTTTTTSTAAKDKPRSRRRADKKRKIKDTISAAIGIDVDVVDAVLTEMEAQEQFMQFCEVFARLTLGKGFEHTSSDETLDDYTQSIKKLYSVDANVLSTLEVVQYMAAKDEVPPVEWARRWYERALLVPLQQTPEYKRLEAIREEERQALRLKQEIQNSNSTALATGNESEAFTNNDSNNNNDNNNQEATPDAEAGVIAVSSEVAQHTKQEAVKLVEKLFMRPDDARLKSLHEKRLRYLAYLQMERQIEAARENARLFAGVENSPEAEVCRELYAKLLARRQQLMQQGVEPQPQLSSENSTTSNSDTSNSNSNSNSNNDSTIQPLMNIFQDDEMTLLFEQIRDVTVQVILEKRSQQKSEEKKAKRDAIVAALRGAAAGEQTQTEQLVQELEAQKRQVGERLLSILEKDVQSEVEWLENMEEAERPPLLPVPEGMSYVSAAEVQAWRELRAKQDRQKGNPFLKHNKSKSNKHSFAPQFLAQPWPIPDKPLLFWGTGTRALEQALQHAAEDADRRRRGEPLAPPYPCPENPWGWRLVKDILDD